jgi:heme-degrading monooxygenase HmoA
MSVMMGLRLTVDPDRFMQVIQDKAEQAKAIAERGRSKGAKRHMFLAGEAEVMVADEWDSEESFLAFFQEAGPEIGQLMAEAGVSNEPQPAFWKPLDTPDRF